MVGYSGVMLGSPTRPASRPRRISELLATGEPTFSFEFFPPKTPEGERLLWRAIRELESLRPSFVSVTYGAGGGTRDRTVGVTERIATDTTLLPVAHMTAVNHSVRPEVAGGGAEEGSDGHVDEHGRHRHEQRHARGVDEARQHVAAQHVGA